MPIIDHIFLSDAVAIFIAAQWKVVASTFSVPEKKAGEKLCTALRKLIDTDNAALRQQVISLQAELAKTEASIAAEEAAMNAGLYRLYGLTKAEIAMVEKDRVA